MTPQQQPTHDAEALRQLGRASVEVVHDIKNQLNGLKLYATFLRKRTERDARPVDELETINKIIAGLERAATELNLLVRYGRTLELHRTTQDLATIARSAIVEGSALDVPDGADFRGDFDAERLTEALREIDAATRANSNDGQPARVSLRREQTAGAASAVIEWHGVKDSAARDLFGELDGIGSLRAALAAKIVNAHGGAVEHVADVVSVRIPLRRDEG
jgi:hypothetical protein